ncbi:unnamed protein product [Alternaria burnsii]|nr:unnamed protein product [Alternaria burnsii]
MNRFTEEQLQQQWRWTRMTPREQQEYRDRLAQRTSQQQYVQPQGHQQQAAACPSSPREIMDRALSHDQSVSHPRPSQQQDGRPEGRLSSQQQQHSQQQWQLRQQQNAQQRLNPMQFPAQSFNPTQLPRSSSMAPPPNPNRIGVFSQVQASTRSVPNVFSSNSLSGANITMAGNGQRQRQNVAQSASKPCASSPLSASSPSSTSSRTLSPQNGATAQASMTATSPTKYQKPSTPGANSHMPALPPSTTQTQSPGSAQVTGRKRQATGAPEGARPADKRPNLMTQSVTVGHTTLARQNTATPHQSGVYHQAHGAPNGAPNGVAPTMRDPNLERREQQAKLDAKHEAELQRIREHQIRVAEQARVAEEYQVAQAAALQREKDDKRREELRKDPSANYRHILEVYKLMPLKKGELPNKYLLGLIANRPMPMDLDSDLALAITYAKDHWDYYGQWPKDVARFAGYERERRAKKLA